MEMNMFRAINISFNFITSFFIGATVLTTALYLFEFSSMPLFFK